MNNMDLQFTNRYDRKNQETFPGECTYLYRYTFPYNFHVADTLV